MNKPVRDLTPEVEVSDPLALLRRPFPANQISKLPKESRTQADERKASRSSGVNCTVCGGWHHKNAVHLDYVGHAALTDRLLDADPLWTWEPVAFTPEGLPSFDRNGGLWIKLTVCGVTRLGYGNAEGKSGGDAVKEIIGDALRNAAMRFGAALDLWHKGDLHVAGAEPEADEPEVHTMASAEELAANLLRGCGSKEMLKDTWTRNEAGWRGVMDEPTYLRLKGLTMHLVKQFDEQSKPPPAEDLGIADDEIPF